MPQLQEHSTYLHRSLINTLLSICSFSYLEERTRSSTIWHLSPVRGLCLYRLVGKNVRQWNISLALTTCHLHTAAVQLETWQYHSTKSKTRSFKIKQKPYLTTRHIVTKSPFADEQMWSLREGLCFCKVSMEIVLKKIMNISWWLQNNVWLLIGRDQGTTWRLQEFLPEFLIDRKHFICT